MNLQASPLHARFCPDQAVQLPAVIVENVRLARDTFRVRLHAPEIARRIVPGQFVMARIAGLNDPLIGRPLALYDTVIGTDGQPAAIDLVYLVKGKLTTRLCGMQPGQLLDVWGPLGNGFGAEGSGAGDQGAEGGVQGSGIRVQGPEIGARTSDAGEGVPRSIHHRLAAVGLRGKRLHAARQHLILVAGGIGQTPFLALAQEALHLKRYGEPPREVPRAERITFCYGARTADYLAGVEDFERLGIDVRIATDDGSRGHPGLVTELLEQV
ncbi:MAG TPA: FAD-binding oxidoreductase, partial [Pirellulaceae bacterium]|nr:FAD-binding oxidoreductase [Pirellulaceae bacterium]